MAYVSRQGGDLQAVKPDGTGARRLMGRDTDDAFSYPDWSPDAGRIVYAWAPEIAISKCGKTDIWVANADGSNPLQITDMPGDEREAAWAPVDDRIAFVADVDGNKEIYVVRADGTGLTNLTNHRMTDKDPARSPDGSQIVFVSNRS